MAGPKLYVFNKLHETGDFLVESHPSNRPTQIGYPPDHHMRPRLPHRMPQTARPRCRPPIQELFSNSLVASHLESGSRPRSQRLPSPPCVALFAMLTFPLAPPLSILIWH